MSSREGSSAETRAAGQKRVFKDHISRGGEKKGERLVAKWSFPEKGGWAALKDDKFMAVEVGLRR